MRWGKCESTRQVSKCFVSFDGPITFRIVSDVSTEAFVDDADVHSVVPDTSVPPAISLGEAGQGFKECTAPAARSSEDQQHLPFSDHPVDAMQDRLFRALGMSDQSLQRRNGCLQDEPDGVLVGGACSHADHAEVLKEQRRL